MYTLTYTTPASHEPHTAVVNVTMELAHDRSVQEMQVAFNAFLRATGYYISDEDEYV